MLRVLHPESRFGGDHYRENVVGKDLFAPLLDYGLKSFSTGEPLAFPEAPKPFIASPSPPAAVSRAPCLRNTRISSSINKLLPFHFRPLHRAALPN